MKLTQLQGSEVLPVKRKELVGFDTCQKTEFRIIGFNEAVSTIEQVSVEVDVEELGRWIDIAMIKRREFIETYSSRKGINGKNIPPIPKLAEFVANAINESKQKWLKLEICPADKKGK